MFLSLNKSTSLMLAAAVTAFAAAPISAHAEVLLESNSGVSDPLCEDLPDRTFVDKATVNSVNCVFNNVTCVYACSEVRTESCFPAGTKIQMLDGSSRSIEEIKVGERVWNPVLQQGQKVVKRIAGPEHKPLYEIGFGDSIVTVTETHPVVVQAAATSKLDTAIEFRPSSLFEADRLAGGTQVRVIRAMDVTTKDSVLGPDGNFHRITVARVLPLQDGVMVYNFELEAPTTDPHAHMIVADGVVTGDVRVQATLNKYQLPWDKKK